MAPRFSISHLQRPDPVLTRTDDTTVCAARRQRLSTLVSFLWISLARALASLCLQHGQRAAQELLMHMPSRDSEFFRSLQCNWQLVLRTSQPTQSSERDGPKRRRKGEKSNRKRDNRRNWWDQQGDTAAQRCNISRLRKASLVLTIPYSLL